jgi:uncharacterized protein YkwD
MPGTPPLGPAAASRDLVQTPLARRVFTLLVLTVVIAAVTARAASPAGAQAPAACSAAAATLGSVPGPIVEEAIACLVNVERAAVSLAPVVRSDALEVAAQRHAYDMVTRRYFAHVSPTGGTVDKRARRAGYLSAPCWVLGEDLGWAPPSVASAQAVVSAWMESPTHRAVILDPEFGEMGIGLAGRAPTADGAGATFVLEFGAMQCAAGTPRSAATPRARVRVG